MVIRLTEVRDVPAVMAILEIACRFMVQSTYIGEKRICKMRYNRGGERDAPDCIPKSVP